MSNVSQVNQNKQNEFVKRVENKINAVQAFIEGRDAVFDVPGKFSLNWFVFLSEGDLEAFSKSSKGIKTGTELRKRVDEVLKEANAKLRKDGRKSDSESLKVAKLKAEIQQLKAENKKLKSNLDTRTNENVELRIKLGEADRKLSINQASWNDQKLQCNVSNINR